MQSVVLKKKRGEALWRTIPESLIKDKPNGWPLTRDSISNRVNKVTENLLPPQTTTEGAGEEEVTEGAAEEAVGATGDTIPEIITDISSSNNNPHYFLSNNKCKCNTSRCNKSKSTTNNNTSSTNNNTTTNSNNPHNNNNNSMGSWVKCRNNKECLLHTQWRLHFHRNNSRSTLLAITLHPHT